MRVLCDTCGVETDNRYGKRLQLISYGGRWTSKVWCAPCGVRVLDAIAGTKPGNDRADRDALIAALSAARIDLPLGTIVDLAKRGVQTVEQLAGMTDSELRAVHLIGPARLARLHEQLDRRARIKLGFGADDADYERFLHGLLQVKGQA